MKVLITIPAFSHNGGIRVALEIANRLTQWHEVYLLNLKGEKACQWFTINPKVKIAQNSDFWKVDCLILTSPHSADLIDLVLPNQKCFLHLQMLEHMFNEHDFAWLHRCKKFYQAHYPMFSISQWNMRELAETFGRRGPTYYIGNGVNFKDFPIRNKPKDGKTVLIEGFESSHNPTKDADKITHDVAARLRREGYKILAYGSTPLKSGNGIPHEYFHKPTLEQMNSIYERATILIKASKYDCRSCFPVEGFTKGSVTARAIILGDDDLIDNVNCLRCNYDANELYLISKKLLTDSDLRLRLAEAGYEHIKKYSWDYWMPIINDIICK